MSEPYDFAKDRQALLFELEGLRAEVRQICSEANLLVRALNAYDGAGIPMSDAGDAFAFLRRLAARAAKGVEDA